MSRARHACSSRPRPRARICGAWARMRTPPRARSPTGRRCSACWRRASSEALAPFLRRSCEAAGVDACAVLSGKTVVAVAGPALDWQQAVTAAAEQGATFLALPATERVPLLGARAALGDQGLTVYVVRRLDEKLARSLSDAGGRGGAAHRLPHLHQRPGERVHAAVLGGTRRRPLRRATHRRRRMLTHAPCRCSPPAARRSPSSRRCCPPARSTLPRATSCTGC